MIDSHMETRQHQSIGNVCSSNCSFFWVPHQKVNPLEAQRDESSVGPHLDVLETQQEDSGHRSSFLDFSPLLRVLLDPRWNLLFLVMEVDAVNERPFQASPVWFAGWKVAVSASVRVVLTVLESVFSVVSTPSCCFFLNWKANQCLWREAGALVFSQWSSTFWCQRLGPLFQLIRQWCLGFLEPYLQALLPTSLSLLPHGNCSVTPWVDSLHSQSSSGAIPSLQPEGTSQFRPLTKRTLLFSVS